MPKDMGEGQAVMWEEQRAGGSEEGKCPVKGSRQLRAPRMGQGLTRAWSRVCAERVTGNKVRKVVGPDPGGPHDPL